ncbi:MAG: hypothetical protein LBE79_00985 [Tannerella sp.]|nr:hypothetical protein [Tannerella sp.]
MKTLKLFCNSLVILLFAGLSINTVAAQTTKKETVTKVYDISQSGNLDLSSHRSQIEILTWDRNEVKVTGELTYEDDGNKEDIAKLLNAFKSMNAESSSRNILKLNLNLIKSSSNNVRIFGRPEITTILYNDEKTTIDANKINVDYTIWIPATLAVKVDSRFGKLKMASIKGNVNFTLHNNGLEMGDFGESGIFDIRFSSVNIGSGGALKVNAHNSTVNAGEVKNATIDARFSQFNIAKAHDVTIDFNNGTAVFGMLNDINATARFSTIRIESNAGKSKFDFNNSDLFGKNFQTMELSCRFSKFNATDIGDIKINSSHNSNFDFNTVNTFSCRESRFSTFNVEEIVANASFPEANNTSVTIKRTSASFTGFSGNFRFGTVNLKLHPSVEYNLNYKGTFGQLNNISADKFKTKFVSDKSGSTTTIQGTNAGAKCNIEIAASNTTCKIE